MRAQIAPGPGTLGFEGARQILEVRPDTRTSRLLPADRGHVVAINPSRMVVVVIVLLVLVVAGARGLFRSSPSAPTGDNGSPSGQVRW